MQTVDNQNIRRIAIVGGGTAGWMTAAALAKVLGANYAHIELIESAAIGTVSVGEATIPQIALFNRILDIDENDFLRETRGSFKLGIEFVNWWKEGHSYIHPFGSYGTDMEAIPFHHFWLKQFQRGQAPDIEAFSLAAVASRQGRFTRPVNMGHSPLSQISYAYHFDAQRYALYLRKYAEARGVKRTEAMVQAVHLRAQDGFVQSLSLDNGQSVEADLFIDCSGFKALIIEKALGVSYLDWSHWLPCNRAVAMPCEKNGKLLPYTRSTARESGWQWRIPLQHRTGNGYVYSSEFSSDERALEVLHQHLDGARLAEPNPLRWINGRRQEAWHKNCVAIGLAGGFIEPLESTGIHLIQSAIAKLMSLFPDRGFAQKNIDSFNDQQAFEFERLRDFIILHYKMTERTDSEFWRYCKQMSIPDTLQHKIDMYQSHGRIYRENNELFNETSWLAVLHGQGARPERYHPLVDILSEEEIQRRLKHIQSVIDESCRRMPMHEDYLQACVGSGKTSEARKAG